MSGGSTLQCKQDIQKLEKYLPLLENLVHYVNLVSDNPRMVLWTSYLKIRWSSALTSSSFFIYKGQKFFQIDSLLFELSMVLFLYGTLLQEWASEILSKDLVQSATLFRKAAGVYRYLAYEVLPSLQPQLPQERPPEATLSVASAMSLICLAEAQEFISSCKALHELRSYTYIAEGLKIDGRIGIAIEVLRHALITAQKNMPGKELWRLVLKQEVDNLTGLVRKYET